MDSFFCTINTEVMVRGKPDTGRKYKQAGKQAGSQASRHASKQASSQVSLPARWIGRDEIPMGKRLFGSILLLFTGIIIFCSTQTVQSREQGSQMIEERYYDEWEAQYMAQMKQLLTKQGLTNSGITMTKIKEADGSRLYEVAIHHRRTGRMSTEQREALLTELAAISFPAQQCAFEHRLNAS